MFRLLRLTAYFLISIISSVIVIHYLAYPTLVSYPRLHHAMDRFAYTQETLLFFFFLSAFLFFLQWEYRYFSAIYLYLVYSIYLFLLFVVLFGKASNYHSYSFDLFDFVVRDKRTVMEAILNTLYFVPLGGLYAFKAKPWEFVLIAFFTILGIETLQYAFYVGTFAFSDILLNFIGCTIGYTLVKWLGYRRIQYPKTVATENEVC